MSDIDRERMPDRELELELDRAIDALNDERQPPVPAGDPDSYWAALDGAMLVRSLRPPAEPDAEFPAGLSARLAAAVGPWSPNGHAPLVPAVPVPARGSRRLRSTLVPAIQTTGAYALAGMAAGVVVGGVGGRIAMRVSAEMFAREYPNRVAISESSGNLVGRFTWSGTFALLAEAMVLGMIGGLFYLVARRWLPRSPRASGLLFGLLVLLIAGTTVISADNRDFSRFGSPVVNVLMFGTIFVLFGLAVAPLSRPIARLAANRDGRKWRLFGRWGLGLIGIVGMLAIIAMVAVGLFELASAARNAGGDDVSVTDAAALATIVAVTVVLPLCRVVLAVIDSGAFAAGRAFRAAFDLAGRLALAVAVVLGATITLREIAGILNLG